MNKELRRHLIQVAQTLPAKYQIGKAEMTVHNLALLEKALTAHELIKITIHETIWSSFLPQIESICHTLNATCVQIIGHKIILYRENPLKRQFVK
jgi:RNA-binding protein